MLNTRPFRERRTTSVTTWANIAPTRRIPPVQPVEQLRTEKRLVMSSHSRPIIENCLLNGVIQPGAKISFPLYLYQQTEIRSMVDKNIILADITSGENFEVKLLCLYTSDEWSSLMVFGNMDPVILPGQAAAMNYGCQIAIIRRIR